ncbi:serine hydrolase, partial [Riemerella anatipestifer]|nr:serine hydrolase [Riemerella anatipestifer]
MKKRSIFIGLSIIFSTLSFGQSVQTEKLDSLFASLHEKKSFNGNVLIAEKGNIVFEKSYGYA